MVLFNYFLLYDAYSVSCSVIQMFNVNVEAEMDVTDPERLPVTAGTPLFDRLLR